MATDEEKGLAYKALRDARLKVRNAYKAMGRAARMAKAAAKAHETLNDRADEAARGYDAAVAELEGAERALKTIAPSLEVLRRHAAEARAAAAYAAEALEDADRRGGKAVVAWAKLRANDAVKAALRAQEVLHVAEEKAKQQKKGNG
jgi:hypothetical protein